MKKILFVGPLHINHIRRLVSKIAENYVGEFEVHLFDTGLGTSESETTPFVLHIIKTTGLKRILFKIPKIGVLFNILAECIYLSRLLKEERFSVMPILQIPMESLFFVKIAHRHKCKTLLIALGSDILRASSLTTWLQRKAFDRTDYVAADKELRFSRDVMSLFNIPESKCRPLGFGSDALSMVWVLKGKFNRDYMQEKLGLPQSKYNIVCGYNAYKSQRHQLMIESLVQIREYLPEGYLIILPFTYGNNKDEIVKQLNEIPNIDKLNLSCLFDYMTAEQVAYLRLITDLFIHIQTTDGYNASLQEFMIAGAQCINGSWLEYDSLEKYGKPYHTIDKPQELSVFLKNWFSGDIEAIRITKECEDTIRRGKDWGLVLSSWKHFFEEC